jgi:hypothetical protein
VVARLALGSAILAMGCISTPTLGVPGAPEPVVCDASGGSLATTGTTGAGALSVVPTLTGATAAWVPRGGGPVVTQQLAHDARGAAEPVVTWPGRYDRVVAAAVGDQVVLGAVGDDVTWMLAAPFGLPPYRELALLAGSAGASPVVVAGGDRVTPTAGFGGLLVTGFDATWAPHTSQLEILTPNAVDVAAVAVGDEAIAVWPVDGACYVARVFGAARGASTVEPIACRGPRLASTGADVALVFEGSDGVYLARGPAVALHPARAQRLAAGTSPRIVAIGGRYWISYLDATGALVAGFVDDSGLHAIPVDSAPDAHDLAVVGDLPRVFSASGGTLAMAALCAE